jgi:hypothetical protein
MKQQEDESLEDYLEIFLYNIHRSKLNKLNIETIGTILLIFISDDSMNVL